MHSHIIGGDHSQAGPYFRSMREARAYFSRSGITGCEVCGWRSPFIPPREGAPKQLLPLLAIHHIVPRSAGGEEWLGNLAVLCANCHRISHVVWGHSDREAYGGPEGRDSFLTAMRHLLADPERWWSKERLSRRWTGLRFPQAYTPDPEQVS